MRAFVSFIQFYRKHECKLLFDIKGMYALPTYFIVSSKLCLKIELSFKISILVDWPMLTVWSGCPSCQSWKMRMFRASFPHHRRSKHQKLLTSLSTIYCLHRRSIIWALLFLFFLQRPKRRETTRVETAGWPRKPEQAPQKCNFFIHSKFFDLIWFIIVILLV